MLDELPDEELAAITPQATCRPHVLAPHRAFALPATPGSWKREISAIQVGTATRRSRRLLNGARTGCVSIGAQHAMRDARTMMRSATAAGACGRGAARGHRWHSFRLLHCQISWAFCREEARAESTWWGHTNATGLTAERELRGPRDGDVSSQRKRGSSNLLGP